MASSGFTRDHSHTSSQGREWWSIMSQLLQTHEALNAPKATYAKGGLYIDLIGFSKRDGMVLQYIIAHIYMVHTIDVQLYAERKPRGKLYFHLEYVYC